MVLTRNIKLLIGLFILADLLLISWGIIYRSNLNRDYDLYTALPLNNPGITLGGIFTLDLLSFPTTEDALEDAVASGSVATGRIQERKMYDRRTGELLGKATLVEVVTPNPTNPLKLMRIPLVVEFSLASDPRRNVMPWVLKTAVNLVKVPVAVNSELISREQVERIFSRGSAWNFIPLLDIDNSQIVLSQVVEFTAYANRYYGGSNYGESGLFNRLLGRSWYPLILDIAPLSEAASQ